MDKRTLEALKGSIAKWEAIVAGTGIDLGPDNCPLCQQFYHIWSVDTNCVGCPVSTVTGKSCCRGTPYDTYDESGESKAVALQELNFLKSLLPTE